MASFSLKTLYALALAYLLVSINGASIPDEKAALKGKVTVLDFKVDRSNKNVTSVSNLSKRDAHPVSLVGKDDVQYLIDVGFGTPPQKVSVSIDTGSSDLWVVDSSLPARVKEQGSYNPAKSSTYQFYKPGFFISYADKTTSEGNWVKDVVQIGDTKVNQIFADANKTPITGGILGIGLEDNESADGFTYPNYPKSLKEQGFIDKIAYSIYLGSLEAQSGTVIFGGIDKAKYEGELVKIQNDPNDKYDLSVDVSSIEADGQTFNVGNNAVLDTGTSWTYVPQKTALALAKHFFTNYKYDSNNGFYYVDGKCPKTSDFKYNFQGTSINVAADDVFVHYTEEDFCALLVIGQPNNKYGQVPTSIFGDNFLRSAYLYYDLEERTTSIAQVKYTSESHIVPV